VATETLKIVITADNKGALSSLKQTAAETDKFKMSLGDLNTRLSLLKERLNQATDPTKISKLGGEIKKVTSQIESQKSAFASLGAETEKAGGAMGSGLNKAFSGLRMIANILPGIGLAGMFGLAFEGLASLVNEMGLFKQETESAFKILSKSGEGFVKASADVNSLNETFKLAKDGTISQKTALDEYNKTLGDALGKTDSFAIAQKNLIDKGPAFVQMMLFESAATLAYKEAAQKAFEATKIAAQPKDETVIFGMTFKNKNLGVTLQTPESEKKLQDARDKARQDNIDKANKESKDLLAIANGFQDKYQAIAKLFNINITKPPPTPKVKEPPLDKLKETYKKDTAALVMMLMEGGMSIDEFGKKLNQLNVSTLQTFFKDGGKAASEFGQELIKLQPAFNEFGKVIQRGELIKKEKKQPSATGGINAILPEGGGMTKDMLKGADDSQSKFNAALKETEAIMSVLGPQIDNMFAAMANGASLGEALGDMFNKLAQDIAKAAIKAAIFSIILSIVAPGSGAAAGGVSGGGGFMSMFGKMLGFAKGGISEGPQGGHMELLHGTEAILTPAQMSGLVRNSMNAGAVTSMGSNSQSQGNQTGEFMLRGNDLVLALQRSNVALNLRRGS
jgi:hypothetical protein